MGFGRSKYIGPTEYKHVCELKPLCGKKSLFRAQKIFNGVQWTSTKETAKAAALALDIKLIELGFEPVNILKAKI